MMRSGRRRWSNDERGIVSLVVVVIVPALLLAAAIAYDGGEVLNAKVQAHDDAAEAARAGAQALSTSSRSGAVDLPAAPAAADAYLATTGHTGTVTVNGTTVTVTVAFDQPTAILAVAGIDHAPISETATATATEGTTGAGR